MSDVSRQSVSVEVEAKCECHSSKILNKRPSKKRIGKWEVEVEDEEVKVERKRETNIHQRGKTLKEGDRCKTSYRKYHGQAHYL